MIASERIAAVLDHPVYDASGSKIGDAKHLFLDDATGVPEWVSVKTGLFGTGESFVPIRDAEVVEDHLQVPFSKDQIKDAPNVDVEAGGACPWRRNIGCTTTTASTGTRPGSSPSSPVTAAWPAANPVPPPIPTSAILLLQTAISPLPPVPMTR